MLDANVTWRPAFEDVTRPQGGTTTVDVERLPAYPRRAADNTPYCVCCPTSLKARNHNQAVICAACLTERNSLRLQRHRETQARTAQRNPTTPFHA